MIHANTVKQSRLKRLARIRMKVKGTSLRPRLTVFRSNTALSVQVVNDDTGTVMMSERIAGKNIAKAKELGIAIAQKMKQKHITTAVFDRSGYRYHGVIQMLVDTVREGGVKI
jgi:large subunit ribosomal protein L18